jgi:ribonuclease HII
MPRKGMVFAPDSLPLGPVADGPDFSRETRLMRRGARLVAGIDEVGRGPLAGPVTVAAVVLDPSRIPPGLDDSKRLRPGQREQLAERIFAEHDVAIVFATPARIDAMNIRGATLWAMAAAARALACRPEHALIDGRDVPPGLPCPGDAVIGGDHLSLSIAAASIVAKVARDRHMACQAECHPGYGFERHVGYGTPEHLAALARLGPCVLHRRSFAPIRALLAGATALTAAPADLLDECAV